MNAYSQDNYFQSEMSTINRNTSNPTFARVEGSNGSANISIPLGSIAFGELNIPITLEYFREGRTIDESDRDIALGWNLRYGGEINAANGKSDMAPIENSNEFQAMQYSYFTNSNSGQFHFNASTAGNYEQDAIQMPMTNNKIKVHMDLSDQRIDSILIQTPSRFIYVFIPGGSLYPEVGNLGIGECGGTWSTQLINKFKLKRITDLDGNTLVSFEHTMCSSTSYNDYQAFNIIGLEVNTDITTSKSVQQDKLLTQIDYGGYSIEIIRNSQSTDNEISHIIFRNENGDIIKKVDFIYDQKSQKLGQNIRFLDKLEFKGANDIVNSEIQLDYYDYSKLESNANMAQDYWGFYNGKYDNESLIGPYEFNNHPNFSNRDRSPNFETTQEGMLKSMSDLNMGGKETYYYELHDYGKMAGNDNLSKGDYHKFQTKTLSSLYYLSVISESDANTNTSIGSTINFPETVSVDGDQTVKLDFKLEYPENVPHISECSDCYYLQVLWHKVGEPQSVFISEKKQSTNAHFQFSVGTGDYVFKVRRTDPACTPQGEPNCSLAGELTCSIRYKDPTSAAKDEVPELGGLRIQKIENSDGNGSTQIANFEYRLSDDPTHSSGVLIKKPELSMKKPVDLAQVLTEFGKNYVIAHSQGESPVIHSVGYNLYDVRIAGYDTVKLSSSSIMSDYYNSKSYKVLYTCITEYTTGLNTNEALKDGREEIGKIESDYSFNHDLYTGLEFPYSQYSIKDWENGKLIERRIYNTQNQLIQKTTNNFDYIRDGSGNAKVYQTGSSGSGLIKTRYLLVNEAFKSLYGTLDISIENYSKLNFTRTIQAFRYELKNRDTYIYDDGQLKNERNVNYEYSTDQYGLLDNVVNTDQSGNVIKTYYKYVKDFPSIYLPSDDKTWSLKTLKNKGLTNEPILTYTTIDDGSSEKLLGASCILYGLDENSTVPYVKQVLKSKSNIDADFTSLAEINVLDGESTFEYNTDVLENIISVDTRNSKLLPIQLSDKESTSASVLINPINQKRFAIVQNGKLKSSRYTSFEDPDYNGGWYYDESNVVAATSAEKAITGDNYYNLGDVNGNNGNFQSATGAVNPALPAGTYLLSYWYKGNADAVYYTSGTGSNGNEISESSFTEHGWTYVEKIVVWTGADNYISMEGNGFIDELRLHEIDATMETKGYYPDGKLKYEASASGDVVTYEYDNKNRLEWVLDRKRNVMEHREYDEKNIADEASYNKVIVSTTRVDDLSKQEVLSAGLNDYDVKKSLTFSDGLGRFRQSIQFRADNTGASDLVQFVRYDPFGRELIKYQPYWATYLDTESDYIQTAKTDQATFYSSSSSLDLLEQTDSPFAETELEASPLQRPIQQGGIGDELQLNGGHTTTMEYGWNDQNDAILKWEYDASDWSVSAPSTFDVNALKKTTQTSPDGKTVHSYTDARGRNVAIAIEARVTTGTDGKFYTHKPDQNGTDGTLRTIVSYTVFDDFGRVIYEIPAKAIEEMGSTLQLDPDNPSLVFQELIDWYKYDARGRVIEKQTPGQGRTYFVYDRKDRLVMSQDAQQKLDNKWSFIKRDTRGRVILKGEIVSVQNRQDHQDYFDTDPVYEESFDPTLSGNVLGYSNIAYPIISEGDLLNVYYFDNYDFSYSSDFNYLAFNAVLEPMEVTRGLPTGSKTRILESDGTLGDWLTTVSYYDTKKRPIQAFTENHKGGWDRIDTYYNLSNQIEKTIQYHRLTSGGEIHTFRTRYTYFNASGRLQNTWCRIDMDPEVLLSNRNYDRNGKLVELKLHRRDEAANFLQRINYRYNAQGNLVFINDPSLVSTTTGSSDFDDVFGQQLVYFDTDQELEYDPNNSSYEIAPRYDGNISAMLWNAKTPDEDGTTLKQNAYIYHYDDFGQMTSANYAADDPAFPGEYNTDVGNFNESVEYQLGGTMRSLSRNGLYMQEGNSLSMDSLLFEYKNAGYKPMNIDDKSHGVFDQNLKHFVDGADAHHEYTYDAVGRTLSDENRGVTFEYNRLGLPRKIVHESGGYYIEFIYDAAGNKLQKKFKRELPGTQQMEVVSKDYIGNFVYENGELTMIYQPEGVIRPTPDGSENTTDYVYDYFIKDYLGNVRVVLTEEDATYTNKFLATMEEVYRQIEEDNFDNVNETAEPLPSGYPIDGSVEFNERIAELSEATGTQIGPSIVLPVRRGDRVSLSTRYFYEEVGEGTTYDNVNLLINEILMSLATSGSGVLQLNETQLIDIASGSGDYGSAIMNLLSSSFDTSDVSRPNSYLIWMLYDNDMKLIPEGSGAKRVTDPNDLGTLIEEDIPALRDGYLHCFVSNSAVQPVSYDNFLVSYLRGKTRQINHYYPYGLSIDGLSRSDEYLNKYTSKELQTGEFGSTTSSSGLEMFDFHARFYDPALGRWFTGDPLNQFSNPYLAMANNPVRYTDPNGMYTHIDYLDDDGGGGGNGEGGGNYFDGDPGSGIEFGWDGGYHGPLGDTEAYRLSNYFSRGSQNAIHYSWQNSLGAHDGDYAPFRSGGNTYYYKASQGGYGYWNDYTTFSGNFFGSEDGSLVWTPILFPVSEWVSFEGGSDFDNWWANTGTAIGLTAQWMFYGEQNRTFNNDRVANAFRNSRIVGEARDFWYLQAISGRNLITNPITNFGGIKRLGGGNFGFTGLVKAGLDPIEQFVGSTNDFTITSDGINITYTFTNVTSFQSLMYGATPEWLNFYNTYQTYIITEPISFNRIYNK